MQRHTRRDHPRACGEKQAYLISKWGDPGSPPRVRGKAIAFHTVPNGFGITPARAGKSAITGTIFRRLRDHPRACGEKTRAASTRNIFLGSPPRVRGKDIEIFCASGLGGITPARAGKSIRKLAFCKGDGGSPPRVRGKDNHRCCGSFQRGITPACAGKRKKLSRNPVSRWDHPRVRGEKKLDKMLSKLDQGSPPRARGKGTGLAQWKGGAGITPACAGKR